MLALDEPSTRTHGNRTSITAQGYDGVLRPTVRVHYFTPGTTNVFWNYAFNAASQLSSVARDNDAFAWTNHYAVQRPYTTNGLNQYSAAGDATFLYDDNGNLTADPKRAFVYDIENRLVSATPLPGSDAVAAALVYDPLGRLFQVASPITGTRRFLYDGDALVAEYDGANQMAKRHVHWPGADLPMVTYEGAGLGTIRQLLADHQGSIVASADASGAAVQINRYDEYGIPGAGNDGTFQYTGQMWLPELGMYHYKARIYSPTLGRFMQVDPIGYKDQFNLYAYVGNDPVNATDPSGLRCTRDRSGEYDCRIDLVSEFKNGEWVRRVPTDAEQNGRFRPFNSRYTATVSTLARMNPNRTARVPNLQGNRGGFRITAGEAKQNLVDRTFIYMERGTNDANTVMGSAGIYNEQTRTVDNNETAVTNRTLSITMRQLVHEGGMHGSPQEWTGGLQNERYQLNHIEHQREYDRPACFLLGETNC